MIERQDEIRALKAREAPTSHRLAELRSAGMHAIRFEFVVRLLHAALREDTVSIFWDSDRASLLEKPLGEASWRLVLGRGRRIEAEFPDLCVLCYPDDPETKGLAEAALDRMVEKVRARTIVEKRTREIHPIKTPPRATPNGGPAHRRDRGA